MISKNIKKIKVYSEVLATITKSFATIIASTVASLVAISTSRPRNPLPCPRNPLPLGRGGIGPLVLTEISQKIN